MDLGLAFYSEPLGTFGNQLGAGGVGGEQGPSTAGRGWGTPVGRAGGSQSCCLGCRGGVGAELPGAGVLFFFISYCCCF